MSDTWFQVYQKQAFDSPVTRDKEGQNHSTLIYLWIYERSHGTVLTVLMNANLTEEQAEIFQFAKNGHNILITGQAGTGKSWVVNCIREDCKQRGRKVALICSSGVACQVYERGVASTAHSYYGLGAADMPSDLLSDRALIDSRVVERLQKVDVIIWDEASMSSARMLEPANATHHATSEATEGGKFAFAGKQMIVVGEFLQLRPVPNIFDAGELMFISNVFKHAIPHRFQLTKLLRQSESNKSFLKALSDVRFGQCSDESVRFIGTLSRGLDANLDNIATHIFFKKNAVLLFNRSRLDLLDGDFIRFDALFEGKGEQMNWPGQKTLFLKSNCKVMLVWNKSDDLKNGSMGIFKEVPDGKMLIEFENVGSVRIERVTWNQRNRRGESIGSVTQFPVILAYSVTCHKSQGLELPAVVLHSSKEFVPGLIYVAMSRVRTQETLQVLGFKTSHVIPADPEVIAQCSKSTGKCDPNLHCCRRKAVDDEAFFHVHDRFEADAEVDVGEDYYRFPIEVSDGMVQAYFEREDTEVALTMAEVFQELVDHESELSTPPEGYLDLTSLLKGLKVDSPCSDFSRTVNQEVDKLMDPTISFNVKAFTELMWFHSFLGLESHIIENADDLTIKVTRGDFTTATAKLHKVFASPEFTEYTRCLFNSSGKCSAPQRSIASELGTAVCMRFLDHLLQLTRRERQEEVIHFDVNEMSAVGKAKVRHVGGWAVRKVLEKARRYVRANLYSENSETMNSVRRQHNICELIEESLVGSVAILEKESTCKETLQVTEARQYRERGLIHINDSVFRFFMALESYRVSLLNDRKMRREGSNLVEVAYQKLAGNEDLKVKWVQCFSEEDAEERKVRKLT